MAQEIRLNAADIQRFAAQAPLGAGYRFELLKREEICALIEALRKVFFPDAPEEEVIVLAMTRGDELIGMFSSELTRAGVNEIRLSGRG